MLCGKKTLVTVQTVYMLLLEYLALDSDINDIRCWIYVGGRLVAGESGIIKECSTVLNIRNGVIKKLKPWKRRLNTKKTKY